MAEFCICGSIIISGHCTNKNCISKTATKSAAEKSAARKAGSQGKKEPKSPRAKRASKCVVYNLYDNQKEENID